MLGFFDVSKYRLYAVQVIREMVRQSDDSCLLVWINYTQRSRLDAVAVIRNAIVWCCT